MAEVSFKTSDHQLRREEKGITFWAGNKAGELGKLVVSKGGFDGILGVRPRSTTS